MSQFQFQTERKQTASTLNATADKLGSQSTEFVFYYLFIIFFMPASMPSIHACVFLTQRTIKMDPPVKESLYPK